MRRRLPLPLAVAFLAAFVVSAHAAGLSTGIDVNHRSANPPGQPTHPAVACNCLWFGTASTGEIARLNGLGLFVTQTFNPADLSVANLSNYQVLVVAYTGPGVIGAQQAAIQAFVTSGGALLVHQPDAVGVTDYTPAGFDVNIANVYWCTAGTDYFGHIVNGAHPIMAGLADADLSGSFDLVGGIGPSYTVLAVNASCLDPSVAAGTLGTGRVAFEDGNVSPAAFVPGSNLYWVNLFAWLCTGSPVPTHRHTWGELKTAYR